MVKRLFLACCILSVLGAASLAGAHGDDTADTTKCDTWWRSGHGTGTSQQNYPSHHHTHSSDTALGDPAHTVVHGQSGHYVVRNDLGYVEVVGGQSYRGPDPQGNSFPGQGGYVQGEVDAPNNPALGSNNHDVDFFAAVFGPDVDQPPAADPAAIQDWAQGTYAKGCVDVAGQHQEQQSREP
jgi:hypothetical protein